MDKKIRIKVMKDGPYLVSGNVPLEKEVIKLGPDNEPAKWVRSERYPDKEKYILCRCGKSKNHPYCDGTHTKIKFDGTETASRKKYIEQAKRIKGPGLVLTDAESYCASLRFCHPKGGIWQLTKKSDDPKSKKTAIQQAWDCSAGRLVVWDKKTGKPIEPDFKPSVSVTEDPQAEASGPIWVKGGVPIESADGKQYEIRNRVTLCRCGKSRNKPFCDGRHISAGFNDGDKSLGGK